MNYADQSQRFNRQLKKSVQFERELFEWLSSRPTIRTVALNGTEHTHAEFVALLRDNESEASKFIRFAPDGVFLTIDNAVFHFDAKVARTLEKDAFQTYMKYKDSGCTVILFVRYSGRVYWQYIERIKFRDNEQVQAGFPPKSRFPIDNDDWIAPRMGNIPIPPSMSGTAYREIDFSSMVPVEFNKP